MRVAAVDIGTNTILLLIAEVGRDGSVRMMRDEQVIPRLGKGVDERRLIPPETFERAASFLETYKALIDEYRVESVVACGTSFLRDAGNRQEFIDFIRKRVGIALRLLSGEEEAMLTYAGAVSEFASADSRDMFAVLDIGGGSTELTIGNGLLAAQRVSLDIGSVRVTERFLPTSPPSSKELQVALEYIRKHLHGLTDLPPSIRLIGVAGTLTTLAALDLQLPHYGRMRVSGHALRLPIVEMWFDRLKTKTVEEIKNYPQILPERADVILAGILILLETMRRLKAETITVSDRGLRYGIALQAAGLVKT